MLLTASSFVPSFEASLQTAVAKTFILAAIGLGTLLAGVFSVGALRGALKANA